MPINKVADKTAAEPKGGFYAAVRGVQTRRSAATISNGANIIFGPGGPKRKTLLSRTTRIPVKGSITIPYGIISGMDVQDKCVDNASIADNQLDARSLLVRNYGSRFLICTDAMDDAPGLEEFYMNGLRNGLERVVDKSIIYNTDGVAGGLVSVIGASAGAAAAPTTRGSVAVNNAVNGEVSLQDIQMLVGVLDPYSYSIEDLVILLNPLTWQEFIVTLTAPDVFSYARINQAERTLDGFSVFLSPAVPVAQAAVASMANYVVGVRRDLELVPCGSCDTTIRSKARLAGAMAGIGGGLSTNTGTNTGTVEVGAEGVYAAYLTGVSNT